MTEIHHCPMKPSVDEIARLLGGEITDAVMKNAREMKKSGEVKKNRLNQIASSHTNRE